MDARGQNSSIDRDDPAWPGVRNHRSYASADDVLDALHGEAGFTVQQIAGTIRASRRDVLATLNQLGGPPEDPLALVVRSVPNNAEGEPMAARWALA